MNIYTETEISSLDRIKYLPLNKCRIELFRMEDWLRREGHAILEEYSYIRVDNMNMVIGVRSWLPERNIKLQGGLFDGKTK